MIEQFGRFLRRGAVNSAFTVLLYEILQLDSALGWPHAVVCGGVALATIAKRARRIRLSLTRVRQLFVGF